MHPVAILARGFACAALCAAAAHADVLVVKATGGGDFSAIAPAVAAAQDGDLILVHPAAPGTSYGPFAIDGKSLTVAAAHATDVVVTRVVAVRNLAAGQRVLLRGLSVEPKTTAPADLAAGLAVSDCAGVVRVESCTITGGTNLSGLPGGLPGVLAQDSDDVGLAHCVLHGGAGLNSPDNFADGTDGGPALRLAAARAWVHESQLTGGPGGHNDARDIGPGGLVGVGDGGAGAVVGDLCTLSLAASSLTGGFGGVQAVGFTGSAGGHGLQLFGPATDAHARSTTFAGGAGTTANGLPLDLHGGFLELLNVATRHLTANSPVREGEALELKVTGHASDVAWLLVSLQPHGAWVSKLKGPLLVGAPIFGSALPLGTVPAIGPLTVTTTLPDLGPVLHADLFVQLVILSDDGTTLENGSAITLLDGGF